MAEAADAHLGRAILSHPAFPRASRYDPLWILQNSMGMNVLWLTEWLTNAVDLRPEVRVLDLGCGKGISSVFLAKEFGARVWAVDLWDGPEKTWKHSKSFGVDHLVVPEKGDARNLPFVDGFFDAILCIDSYIYFGTDDHFLNYILKFLTPGGTLAVAMPGLMKDFEDGVPQHLKPFWGQDCWCWHTLEWWKHLWERTGLVDMVEADTLPDGCGLYVRWKEAQDTAGLNPWPHDTAILKQDAGEYVGFIRLAARKR